MEANVYDFDGTIYDGDSSIDFYFFVLRIRPLLMSHIPFFFIQTLRYTFGLVSKEKWKESFYQPIIKHNDFDRLIQLFWQKYKSKIKSFYISNKNVNDIIITAGPDFLIRPLLNELGVYHLIATRFDIDGGKILGKNCHGAEKVNRLKSTFPNIIVKEFYSDSNSDLPMTHISNNSYKVSGNSILVWDLDDRSNDINHLNFLSLEFIRFAIIGGAGTLTNFSISLIVSLFIDPVATYVLAYFLSLFVTYTLDSKLLFKKKISVLSYLKFVISYIPNFVILLSFVALFINVLNWNRIVVYGLAGILAIPLTYVIVKIIVFRKVNTNE
jgi:HAD superfamily phosphoserine phosphatase-like hydrolase